MKDVFLFIALIAAIWGGNAQVTNEGKPKSWDMQDLSDIKPIVLPQIDVNALEVEDKTNDLNGTIPWRFGKEILIQYNLDNAGEWTVLENGNRIWRIRFQSSGAKTLNFVFDDFYMPEGATLYLV